jgi:hypothetical protein
LSRMARSTRTKDATDASDITNPTLFNEM